MKFSKISSPTNAHSKVPGNPGTFYTLHFVRGFYVKFDISSYEGQPKTLSSRHHFKTLFMSKNKNDKKKLSIDDFKASASKTKEALSKIVGGVLDNCHTKPPTDEEVSL